MMSGRKAVFLDIDGTLLWNGEEPPCAADIAALRQARAQGHYVFVNTGRAQGFLPRVLLHADYLDGFLCGCGTQFIRNGKTVFGACMEEVCLHAVVRFFLERPQRGCVLEAEDGSYSVGHERAGCVPVMSVQETDGLRVTKATVFSALNKEEKDFLTPWFDLISMPRWYEAVLHGNGKGVGIERVCRLLGVPVENSIAIGDSENDLDMFAHAGISVAMGNASAAALAAADRVTGRCGEGGVAQAVKARVLAS